jgi:hypothetical protein
MTKSDLVTGKTVHKTRSVTVIDRKYWENLLNQRPRYDARRGVNMTGVYILPA